MAASIPAGAPIAHSTRGELPILRLSGCASTLDITPHGAQVLGWQPDGARPVLFLSPRSSFVSGKAIRGGIPLIFPWFGPKAAEPGAPSHGFARVRSWTLEAARVEPGGEIFVALSLSDDERTRQSWPHAFAARLTVRAGKRLEIVWNIRNTGNSRCTFEAALHTYFAVSDVRGIAVQGLAAREYVERYGPPGRRPDEASAVRFPGEVDRLYGNTPEACTIVDPAWKRRILIEKSGSRSTVVWNPGEAKGAALGDLGSPAWKDFVCVETANVGDDAVTLAPGAAHDLAATISLLGES